MSTSVVTLRPNSIGTRQARARTHTPKPQPTTPVSSEQHLSSLPRFPNSCCSPRPHPPAALPGPLLHHFGPRRREQAAGEGGGGGRLLKCQSLPAVTGGPL